MKFIVFGLGSFGAALSQQLVSLGHEVIGVDNSPELVDKYKNNITHTIVMDAANPEAMRQLPMNDIDAAIVGIGENEGVTVMVTAILKQMKVGRIICRVISPLQKIVLESMNIEEFVYPEASSAERLALKLDLPGVINSFRFRDEYRALEVHVPERYAGRTVDSIRLEEKYRLVLITIVRDKQEKNIFGNQHQVHQVLGPVDPETKLLPSDILFLFGKTADLETFINSR